MAEASAVKAQLAEANYKETIESILVAFILAFIFRAFVVEAFVIPTGSMAPTLYGAHIRYQCPDCGYQFDVGVSVHDSITGDDVDIPSTVKVGSDVRCPNCDFVFPGGSRQDMPVRFGDRILVLKYLYLFQPPRRWDVVVFKAPTEGSRHVPNDPEYGQNYIKRLIGRPDESVVILDGDIFTGSYDAKSMTDAWTIQRKPRYVQDVLWRIVFDNDFVPRFPQVRAASSFASTWVQPWQAAGGSGWNLSQGSGNPSRVFSFSNSSGDGSLFFNTAANGPNPKPSEWLAYDQIGDNHSSNIVSDLKLHCVYTRTGGAGPLRMVLSRSTNCFTLDLSPGKATLYRSTLSKASDPNTGAGFDPGPLEQAVAKDVPELAGSAPVDVDFENVDYRVILRINGRDVLSYDYDPDIKLLWQRYDRELGTEDRFSRPEIRLAADHQDCRIEHLSLWRDIYYGNLGDYRDYRDPPQGGGRFWGSPGNPVHLKSDEYFVLGDNSPISGDARYWGDPVRLPREDLPFVEAGRVPERFMLGKAFFVYWPAGYKARLLPINLIPDFGEMRMIR